MHKQREWEKKQASKQTHKERSKHACNKTTQKSNATPTLKLKMHESSHMKWYFQCSHLCIGWPMLVKAWFANNTTVWTSRCERYNNEDRCTPSLNASIEQKLVEVHDLQSMDIPWCCVQLHVDVEHTDTLDYDMQEHVRKVDHLHCSWVHIDEWWGALAVSTIS